MTPFMIILFIYLRNRSKIYNKNNFYQYMSFQFLIDYY